MEDKTVFNDLIEALDEVEEWQNGNIELRTRTIEVPDDEVEFNQVL